jgi:hypothetical protein
MAEHKMAPKASRTVGQPAALDLAQAERFKQAARALKCDEEEAAFDEKLKGIARQKVKESDKTPQPAKAT